MAESQKTDPPVKSKEKNSLLDLDIDKDFLGSWKSMSMGDEEMDFDFGPTTKGKQKAFKFDKMDMDFSLDTDFDKLSSFKMDMPGLDISSPIKKSGKLTEKSKEVSSGGVNRSKRESFAFSFDFDGFADLGFETKKTKIDENSDKSKDKEGYSNASISGGSGDLLAKDVDASEDDAISLKHPASRGVTNSKVDTQTDNIKTPDPRTEDVNLKSVIDESSLLKAANPEEQEIQRTKETIQESPSEKRYSPEHVVQKVVQDSYVHSEDTNVSTEGVFSDMQEEESRTLVRMVSPSTGDEQNDNVRPVAELVSTRDIPAQSEKGEMCDTRDDNVITKHIDSSDTSNADSHLESYVTPGIENLTHEEMADKSNGDSFLELQGNLLGRTTFDELVSDKERENIPIRSKYFAKQNGSESELQPASSTKLSIGNKRTDTLPSNPALEKREFGSRSLESGSKFTGVSRSLPKVLNGDITVQKEKTEASHVKSLENTREPIGNKRTNTLPINPSLEKREFGSRSLEPGSKFTGVSRSLPKVLSGDLPVQIEKTEENHVNSLENTREALNADNIRPRSESKVTTVENDISPMKVKPMSKRNDQNNVHRSDVQPSSSIEQLRKNISLNITNPGTSTHNMRKAVVKENRISLTTAEMKASEVSSLRVFRPTELKLKTPNSLLPKGLTSMRNKDQSPELQGKTVFKRNLSVDTRKETPPTPTLKRKAFEESVDIPQLTPLKRLSTSPCSNKITSSSAKAVVEEQGCNHTSMAHAKSPILNVSLTEMDISSIDNDGIFEKAEACSKELEDICNMLKKKHEEANDLLVRAIVNNNYLLMLNHPIYQDKIRMVQKFAELQMSK